MPWYIFLRINDTEGGRGENSQENKSLAEIFLMTFHLIKLFTKKSCEVDSCTVPEYYTSIPHNI